jgi:hypothetical protein
VFDDEIERLAEEYGDRDNALEIAESDHDLLRFYLPPRRAGRSSAAESNSIGRTTIKAAARAPRTSAST